LKQIASRVHTMTRVLAEGLSRLGYKVDKNGAFFDTIRVDGISGGSDGLLKFAVDRGINLRKLDGNSVGISLDETVSEKDLQSLFLVFAGFSKNSTTTLDLGELVSSLATQPNNIEAFKREGSYLTQPVFNKYHTEHEMLRYIHRLEARDSGLNNSMIPLGSCTMKLNATSEMIPVTWPEIGSLHPFVPLDQAQGILTMINELEERLACITGFHSVSLQPNSGAQGEYTGLLCIKKFHERRGQGHRNVCLIPTSAHGTNPASAVMAGMKVVVVECDKLGDVDVEDLKRKAEKHKDELAALMITYPSTHGVFEESIIDICKTIHDNGGQVYMDGANMNAQVALTSPGFIGADVCHLNLHKTFCIPHGGGGPGVGAIGVAKHLTPFLPGNPVVAMGGEDTIGAVSAAPWGSASIMPISYVYVQLMGASGLKKATSVAILNANYMANRLQAHYPVLYRGSTQMVAHEFILDMRGFKATCGIEAEDIAKRLIDYGFHAPTLSFPIPNTLMIEPTESESKEELDRFCDALISIRAEIMEIEEGKADKGNNLLTNAPHTQQAVISDSWDRPYSRERAAFPAPWLRIHKHWPTVGRIEGAFGDRNLLCTCAPIATYQ